jgi:zinc finger HIT domain-containing protein 1
VRQTQANSNPLDPALIARRAKKHLDELEVITAWPDQNLGLTLRVQRSNHTEADIDPDQADGAAEGSGRRGRGTARQTLLSDKRPSVHPNKKSTMNIRTALLYKKNLATLLEESVSSNSGLL